MEQTLTKLIVHVGIDRAPSSVRDQVADHESNAVKYYLNEVVDFDTAAAFHKRPSNGVVQRELRSATLLADNTAPMGITDAQSQQISNHPEVRQLRRRCWDLTEERHRRGYRTWKDAAGTDISEQKRQADAELSCKLTSLREEAKKKNRQRHFRRTDTAIFNQQYEKAADTPGDNPQDRLPHHYQVSERVELIHLLCYLEPAKTEEEGHSRRLEYIRLLVRWQGRKESPRRGREAVVSHSPSPESPATGAIPEKYDTLQCPFCLSDRRLPWPDREKRKSKINKLWDRVENIHEQELAAFSSGSRHCGICGMRNVAFVPESISHFKNHTQTVHGIRLRP